MGKLKYLVIHCTDTPPKMEVTPEMIRQWHMSPKPVGRGWDRVGYSDMIQRDGDLINLTPYDGDDNITSDEMTWGAVGYNAISRHIVLVGGKGNLGEFRDHFTDEQEDTLRIYLKRIILRHPDIKIIGHNQVAEKTCPGFSVFDWLKDRDLDVYGIEGKIVKDIKPPPVTINFVTVYKLIKKYLLKKRDMCLRLFKKPESPFMYGKQCLLSFAINDYAGAENDLRGCLNDQEDTAKKIKNLFPEFSIKKLQDAECKKSAFASEIRAAFAAMPTGVLVIQYSGHGTYTKDRHGDESDGYDEALYLYDGALIDDDINEIMKEKPAGLQVVFLFDSCFSDTVTRMVGNYKRGRFLTSESMPADFKVKKKFNSSPINWIAFSGCGEHQTSADAYINGRYNGAFTYYALKTLQKGMTYKQWYDKTRGYLPSDNFDQIPGLDGPEELINKQVFEV